MVDDDEANIKSVVGDEDESIGAQTHARRV
jgi:hypothetical protein